MTEFFWILSDNLRACDHDESRLEALLNCFVGRALLVVTVRRVEAGVSARLETDTVGVFGLTETRAAAVLDLPPEENLPPLPPLPAA